MTRSTIRNSVLILLTLYLGTSVWMFGQGRFRHQTKRTIKRHHVARAFSVTREHGRGFNRTQRKIHRRLLPLQTRLHHTVFRLHNKHSRFRREPIHHVRFSKRRPRDVPLGFKAVRIPSQRVKSGRKSTFFARRWAVIESDEKISPSELVPVQVSGQWTLRWKKAPE